MSLPYPPSFVFLISLLPPHQQILGDEGWENETTNPNLKEKPVWVGGGAVERKGLFLFHGVFPLQLVK